MQLNGSHRRQALAAVAGELVAAGKGILAADESSATMTKRLLAVGAESTPESRRRFRELLITTPGTADHISGVILCDETLRQPASDGATFPELLVSRGMITGIKVDTGAKALAGTHGEKITEGLDGLRERLGEHHELGARFAKWRATIAIGDGRPSRYCIATNAHALGRYAALCQEADIVPIVEPEVLMEGDHPIERSEEVTRDVLRAVFSELLDQGVALEGIVLKPNMVLAGYDCPEGAEVEEVAACTLRVLRPWQLTFSYGRALQATPLRIWAGQAGNASAAQAAFARRIRCTSEARAGRYTPALEHEVATG